MGEAECVLAGGGCPIGSDEVLPDERHQVAREPVATIRPEQGRHGACVGRPSPRSTLPEGRSVPVWADDRRVRQGARGSSAAREARCHPPCLARSVSIASSCSTKSGLPAARSTIRRRSSGARPGQVDHAVDESPASRSRRADRARITRRVRARCRPRRAGFEQVVPGQADEQQRNARRHDQDVIQQVDERRARPSAGRR